MKSLLRTNKHHAMMKEAGVNSSTFWIAGIARHYRERAELLEDAFSESGDEHSVMILLEDDLKMAEEAFADASRVDNGVPKLSAVAYLHRDALTRLAQYMPTTVDTAKLPMHITSSQIQSSCRGCIPGNEREIVGIAPHPAPKSGASPCDVLVYYCTCPLFGSCLFP